MCLGNSVYSPPHTGVCIAQYESTFNTEAHNTRNYDGSEDFGLFQLNNRYWCGYTRKNECQMSCEGETRGISIIRMKSIPYERRFEYLNNLCYLPTRRLTLSMLIFFFLLCFLALGDIFLYSLLNMQFCNLVKIRFTWYSILYIHLNDLL